ncbi:protein-L-isoaspartate O-methyltransferase [Rhodobacteraceae bacterium XHP0102]|nr:protein-L-isoaspartate O-methyltransferase [Rhodobacteraceae bacterium XHP0102]
MADFKSQRVTMVDTQVRPSDVTKFQVIDAMLSIPREVYVPTQLRDIAYIGENLTLGGNRVILEGRSFAKMLDALDIGPRDLVLDVAAGLGYSTAVLAHMAEAVVAVEEQPEFAKEAEANFAAQSVDNAAVICAPHTEGATKYGPYDVIVVNGAVEVLPVALTDQLKEGGRMAVIFAVGALCELRIGRKIEGQMNWRLLCHANAPVLDGFKREASFQL